MIFSADFQQREKEKARIEKTFTESDKKLGELVSGACCLIAEKKILYQVIKAAWFDFWLHVFRFEISSGHSSIDVKLAVITACYIFF